MTNTDTNDIGATVEQFIELVEAGADLVRVAVPGLKEVEALRKIKTSLIKKNIKIPLVADVHFLPEVAEKTAYFVEKVRINPGNYSDFSRAKILFDICKEFTTTIRVGVNQGSLSKRIISQFGHGAEALVESALEWIELANKFKFHNIVFSIKSSNVKTMMQANTLLYNKMVEQGRVYPFHFGVTEAANEMEGRVKSAVGIGALLLKGLGNTFRVSLTENPVNEILFSKLLVEVVKELKGVKKLEGVNGVRDGELVRFSDGILFIRYNEKNIEKWWAGVGALTGKWWLEENITDIKIENPHFDNDEIEKLRDCLLQICGIKKTKTEIIACPTCGRTRYDLQSVLAEIKKHFSNYQHLKIAVMGCVVNGPGEMADADFGIIGSANNKVAVYKGNKRISDFLPIPEALKILHININH